VKVGARWFPPLADPALWRSFVHHVSDLTGHPSGRSLRDDWHCEELCGDKFLANTATRLFRKYSIPHGWSNNLLRGLLSNDYQNRISIAMNLPDQLASDPIGKKGPASTLEVYLSHTLR
jgi:hypothetical protein